MLFLLLGVTVIFFLSYKIVEYNYQKKVDEIIVMEKGDLEALSEYVYQEIKNMANQMLLLNDLVVLEDRSLEEIINHLKSIAVYEDKFIRLSVVDVEKKKVYTWPASEKAMTLSSIIEGYENGEKYEYLGNIYSGKIYKENKQYSRVVLYNEKKQRYIEAIVELSFLLDFNNLPYSEHATNHSAFLVNQETIINCINEDKLPDNVIKNRLTRVLSSHKVKKLMNQEILKTDQGIYVSDSLFNDNFKKDFKHIKEKNIAPFLFGSTYVTYLSSETLEKIYSKEIKKVINKWKNHYIFFLIIISVLAYFIAKNSEIKNRLAYRDSLTGAYNLRFINEILDMGIKKFERDQEPLSIIFLDINHLKYINDKFGHEVGDEVIVKVVEIIRKSIRASDYIARIGGDEFLIVLLASDQKVSQIISERIYKNIAKYNESSKEYQIHVSMGSSTYNRHMNRKAFIAEADYEMYKNKEAFYMKEKNNKYK